MSMRKGYSMRRKLFVFVMAFMAFLFLLDALNLPLKSNNLKDYEGANVDVVGKVVKIEDKDDHLSLKVRPLFINGNKVSGRNSVQVNYYQDEFLKGSRLYRETVRLSIKLNIPNERRNPRCFDYRKYLLSEGIWYTASTKNIEILSSDKSIADRISKYLLLERENFKFFIPEEERGIIMGVLFGDTSSMDEDTYENFRTNGTAHVLAVSGLHIGILYNLYKRLCRKRKRKIYTYLFVFTLFSYGTLSMWSTSTIRAVSMIVLIMIGEKLALRYDSLTALSLVALILIIVNPYIIFGASFQMSFLAILSLKFMDRLIPKNVPKNFRPSISITIGLGIYQIYVFNYFAPLSFIVNIPIIYLAGYLVPISLITFLSFSALGFAPLIKTFMVYIAKLLNYINNFSTLGGHSSFQVISPEPFIAMFICLTLFFIASETYGIFRVNGDKKKIKSCFSLILAISIVFELLTFNPITHDDIIFIDVGQGDSMHINLKNNDVIIDGGGQQNYNVGKNILKSYLLKNGNRDVDLAIATHLHMDHYKGLEELMNCYKVKKIAKNMVIGNDFVLNDDVKIKTLWPVSISNNQEDNEECSVFRIDFKGYRIITTGDLDMDGERKMIEYYRNSLEGIEALNCDILKIGHHGSKYSTSDEFLEVTSPTYAVCQVGKNTYGHPSTEVIEKCQKNGIIVLRNDEKGAIGFSFKKRKIISHQMI